MSVFANDEPFMGWSVAHWIEPWRLLGDDDLSGFIVSVPTEALAHQIAAAIRSDRDLNESELRAFAKSLLALDSGTDQR